LLSLLRTLAGQRDFARYPDSNNPYVFKRQYLEEFVDVGLLGERIDKIDGAKLDSDEGHLIEAFKWFIEDNAHQPPSSEIKTEPEA
jgi:hypothetical protein